MHFKKILSVVLVFLFILSCKKNSDNAETLVSDIYQFKSYISDVSSGLISKKSTVRVDLVNPVAEWTNNLELDASILSVSPKIKGKVIALTNRTISFVPETEFEQNTEYVFELHLDKFQKNDCRFQNL